MFRAKLMIYVYFATKIGPFKSVLTSWDKLFLLRTKNLATTACSKIL